MLAERTYRATSSITGHMQLLGAGALVIALAYIIGTRPLGHSTLLVCALGATFMILRYPWLAWCALAVSLPVAAGIRLFGVAATDLLLAGGTILWAAQAITRRRWQVVAIVPLWPILLYVVVLYTAALGAGDLGEAAAEVIKWLQFAVLLLVAPLVTPTRGAPWLAAVLLAAAAMQGMIGLYQFYFRIGPEWFIIQDRFMRAYGVFNQPNPYAGYLGVSLPVALSLLLWAIDAWRHAPLQFFGSVRVAGLTVATALIAAGLFASWSRGGWLGAAAAVVVVVTLVNRRGALVAASMTLVAGPAALVGLLNPAWIPAAIRVRLADIPAYFGAGDVINQPVTDANFAVVERLAHWIAALRMWEGSLWFGVGPGNYNYAYAAVALPQWPDPLGHAHNIYLNVLAESGLIGLLAFCVMWGSLIVWTVKQQRTLNGADWRRALAIGMLGVYAHLAVHSVFDNLFVQGIYLHLAFWPAVLAAALPWESENRAC